MSRKFLPMLLAVALVAMGFSFAAKADVSGSFDVFIIMQPQTTSGETTKMDFDFETVLDLTVTISGLSMSHQFAFGIGGVEHYVATLQATLGALDIMDEFVFATPYYDVSSGTKTDYGGVRRGTLMFVKKRVTSEISLGGVTFNNLFMLEDTTFPAPDDDDTGDNYQTQNFAVGDIITITGETPSGILVTGQTGLCADWYFATYYPKHQLLKIFEEHYNEIKKKSWDQVVEADCYGFGVETDDDGFKPAFAFTKEILAIQNIPFPSGITVDAIGVFSSVPYKLTGGYLLELGSFGYKPLAAADIPFFFDMVIQVPVAGLADVLIELWTDDIDNIWLDALVLTFQLPEHGWSIHWYDFNGDLTFTSDDLVVFKGGLSFQDAVAVFATAALKPTIGLNSLDLDVELPISWPEPYGSLEFDFDWVRDKDTDYLRFDDWTFELTKEWAHNEFQILGKFDKYEFVRSEINVKVTFDI